MMYLSDSFRCDGVAQKLSARLPLTLPARADTAVYPSHRPRRVGATSQRSTVVIVGIISFIPVQLLSCETLLLHTFITLC
jgi:hypothetical protein